jgi:hypothetical protein
MTLGTADDTGLPWVSPVYYAVLGYSGFVWGVLARSDTFRQSLFAPRR